MRRTLAFWLALACMTPGAVRAADPCEVDPAIHTLPAVAAGVRGGRPPRPGPLLEPGARADWIEHALHAGAREARTWAVSWGTTFGIAALAQGVGAVLVSDRGLKIDLSVGASAALVGTATRLIIVTPAVRQLRRLRRLRTRDACARAHAAERALVDGARAEGRMRSVGMHLLALGFSAGVGVVLGVGFRRPLSANRQVMLGGVAGQVMMVTMPSPLTQAAAVYRGAARAGAGLQARPLVLRGGGGATLGGRF